MILSWVEKSSIGVGMLRFTRDHTVKTCLNDSTLHLSTDYQTTQKMGARICLVASAG
jgi:hypothetical protein